MSRQACFVPHKPNSVPLFFIFQVKNYVRGRMRFDGQEYSGPVRWLLLKPQDKKRLNNKVQVPMEVPECMANSSRHLYKSGGESSQQITQNRADEIIR
jgi:hypothetical protein